MLRKNLLSGEFCDRTDRTDANAAWPRVQERSIAVVVRKPSRADKKLKAKRPLQKTHIDATQAKRTRVSRTSCHLV